jgi:ATP-dependent protease ClpP protease subunit
MKANFNYIHNFQDSDKTAEMFIYDEIGPGKVDGVQFAYEMRYLIEVEKVDLIKVRINSPGGDVMQGLTIASNILNANSGGKVAVDTYNDGVAASAAGFIFLCGRNCFAKDYSRIMVHGVSAKVENEDDQNAVNNFKQMITKVISNRTGIDPGFIDNLMSNKKDNWYNTEEAIKTGFLKSENIENTGINLGLSHDLDRKAFAVANKAKQFLNEVKPKHLTMKNVIAKLGLQEAASEEATLTAVSNVIKERDEAKTALTDAQNKAETLTTANAELLTQLQAVNKSSALNAVDNAIKEGKFAPKDEAAKAALILQAENNLEGFNAMIGMMPTKAANILSVINQEGEADGSALTKVANRGLRQLEKDEPTLVSEIRNNFKAEYIKMYNAAYNTNKTEAELYN